MNKLVAGAVAGLVLGCMSAASALDMSVGGGGLFVSDFGGMGMNVSGGSGDNAFESKTKVSLLGGGINAFFDATYAEVSLGLAFAGGSPYTYRKQGSKDTSYTSKNISYSTTSLNIGLLGKYPIALGDNLSLYPAVGIDYALVLAGSTKYKKDEDAGIPKDTTIKFEKDTVAVVGDKVYEAGAPMDYSQFWIKFGAGLDYSFTDKIFLRSELLYGIGFAPKVVTVSKDAGEEAQKDAPSEYKADYKTLLSHGLTVKVGVGFRL